MLAETPSPDPTARHRLPARGIGARRLQAVVGGIIVLAIVTVPLALIGGIPTPVRFAVPLVLAALLVVDAALLQPIRHRLWWYVIDDEEIQIGSGWPITTHTAIPMVRVQHVSVSQGPLLRRYDLADLQINTAAGAQNIPYLDRAEADRIRVRIAELARIPDDL